MVGLRQIDDKKLLRKLQKRIQTNQVTARRLTYILEKQADQAVKCRKRQYKQAAKDYKEWANDPEEWKVDEKEEWNDWKA